MKKTCTRCNISYETDTEDEMKQFFYKKTHGYFQNVCIKCTLKEHSEKYKSGKYDYRKDIDEGYGGSYSIGNYTRCCYISNYDNYPFFNKKRKIK